MKCHTNTLFFSIQRFLKDLAFHLLEFSIHKSTLSPLKPFSIHAFHPATLSIRKRVLSKEKHYLSRTNSVKENFYKHKRDFEQRLCNRGYRLLPLITRLHRNSKRFSWNTGTSSNSNLNLHISLNNHRLYLTETEGKITHGHFSPRKTSFNHAAIIKTNKHFQKVCFQTRRKFTYNILLAMLS